MILVCICWSVCMRRFPLPLRRLYLVVNAIWQTHKNCIFVCQYRITYTPYSRFECYWYILYGCERVEHITFYGEMYRCSLLWLYGKIPKSITCTPMCTTRTNIRMTFQLAHSYASSPRTVFRLCYAFEYIPKTIRAIWHTNSQWHCDAMNGNDSITTLIIIVIIRIDALYNDSCN